MELGLGFLFSHEHSNCWAIISRGREPLRRILKESSGAAASMSMFSMF